MDADVFPEADRRRSARTLSALLAVLALVLAAGAALVAQAPDGRLGLALAEGVLALAAAVAAGLEWTRHRLAEAVALGTVGASFLAAPVLLAWSWWGLGVAQGVVALVAALALARRFLVRDEARHRPRGKAA